MSDQILARHGITADHVTKARAIYAELRAVLDRAAGERVAIIEVALGVLLEDVVVKSDMPQRTAAHLTGAITEGFRAAVSAGGPIQGRA